MPGTTCPPIAISPQPLLAPDRWYWTIEKVRFSHRYLLQYVFGAVRVEVQ